jgi:hypothetical protein
MALHRGVPNDPGGCALDENGVIDDGFLRRYRELLDAEDAAFDELEHAVEDGDRAHYEADLESWKSTVVKRNAFLERQGIASVAATA